MPFFFYSTSLFTGTCTKACQKRCLISRSLSVLLVTRARSLVTVPGSVTGVVGFPISVPCDLTPPSPGDSPHLILWYKNIFGTPIYRCGQITVDTKRLPFNNLFDSHKNTCNLHNLFVIYPQKRDLSILR